ncbi:DUF3791 domain-containing protein [Parabacteroides sp. PF5-9]|uniref:DUF3791 domain-containing protein n=1 Tax=Parabacteroides sp. PF5-9 TaxID=1742404 RepID=UPI00247356D3|nr:DUF3791 domain-containing protein [Parabacteroides sp. PF5-9]MDH6357111.1 transcriptional regulator with XRE-family HTH domain [Parabacteroides sp. PF5-9]
MLKKVAFGLKCYADPSKKMQKQFGKFPKQETFYTFTKKIIMTVQIDKIGLLIREERVRCGMTQEELGIKIGVGKAQISKIESGKGLTIKTINKVLAALNLSTTVRLAGKKSIDKRIVGYVVAVINEFAKTYNLTVREASNYLHHHKGLEFLEEHYEAEHLLSIEDSVQDLARICRNQGGGIV